MLHVLRHYLPIRKALLIGSELFILTLIVMGGMSAHLWRPDDGTQHILALQRLDEVDARWHCLISAVMVSILAQIAIGFNELYDFRISSSRYDRASRFLTSAGSAILLVIAVILVVHVWGIDRALDFPGLPFSQLLVLLMFAMMLGFVLLYLWRNLFHFILRRFSFNERLLILGTGPSARRLYEEMQARDDAGYDVIGMVAPSGAEQGPDRSEDRRRWRRDDESDTDLGQYLVSALGGQGSAEGSAPRSATTLLLEGDMKTMTEQTEEEAEPRGRLVSETLYELARRLEIDDIVVAMENRRGQLPTRELLQCRLRGIVVEEAESLYARVTGKIAVEAMRPSYLIFSPGFVQHPLAEAAKRSLDVLLALLVLLVSWPVMALCALAIGLDSKGPILFRQERVGRFGRRFTLLKFRSMRRDAERFTGPVWASEADPRVTRVGRVIRRMRVDELPQILNVLAGSMSLVGPRPERQSFVDDLTNKIPYYGQRHIVKPGVTGWAQINYPYGNTLEDASQKLQYDLFYIKYKSLLFDLSILFNTIKTVLLRKGT